VQGDVSEQFSGAGFVLLVLVLEPTGGTLNTFEALVNYVNYKRLQLLCGPNQKSIPGFL
jgi:hypothetical protein